MRNFELVVARCGCGGRCEVGGRYFTTGSTDQTALRDRALHALQQEGYYGFGDVSLKDPFGALITKFRPYNMVVPPFFSNLLPEGPLCKYLADRAGVKPSREFFLLWMLGRDLTGAVTVHPSEGDDAPPDDEQAIVEARPNALRFRGLVCS